MSKFAFTPGSPFDGDADEVQAELDSIRRSGGLTPAAVVAVARPRNSTLHKYVFNVGKDEAAERYYHDRARKLIISVVHVDQETEQPTLVPQYVRVVEAGEPEYVPIDEPGAHDTHIWRIKRDMRRLRDRLKAAQEFPAVVAALEEALAA